MYSFGVDIPITFATDVSSKSSEEQQLAMRSCIDGFMGRMGVIEHMPSDPVAQNESAVDRVR